MGTSNQIASNHQNRNFFFCAAPSSQLSVSDWLFEAVGELLCLETQICRLVLAVCGRSLFEFNSIEIFEYRFATC